MNRSSKIHRKTDETEINISLNIDGIGKYKINTPIGFFNHMLTQIAKHGKFDIEINAKGDTEVDYHHLVEDIGITLGLCFKEALKNYKGIKRFSTFTVPMDEALTNVTIDISNRPFLIYNVKIKNEKVGDFDTELVREFFISFTNNFRCTLHINNFYGDNSHHIIESIFKAFAICLKDALKIVSDDIPSTKGVI